MKDDWDTVLICLKFPSGVIANIDICRHAPYGYGSFLSSFIFIFIVINIQNKKIKG